MGSANNPLFSGKPAGDKENIPLAGSTSAAAAAAKKPLVGASRTEVIDLCEAEDDRCTVSRTNTPNAATTTSSTTKTSSSGTNNNNNNSIRTSGPSSAGSGGDSAPSPEVIDLCHESPIRRSVPSIAATLMPRKRKLDILREGGLEVTPVSIVSLGTSSSRDIVTITRQPPAASGGGVVDDHHQHHNHFNRSQQQQQQQHHHNHHHHHHHHQQQQQRQQQLQQQQHHHQYQLHQANSIAAYMERLSASVPKAEMSFELVDTKHSGSGSSSSSSCSSSSSSGCSDDDDSSSSSSSCSNSSGGSRNDNQQVVSAMPKPPPQILDLRTLRNNVVDSSNLLKSISPSLGPNIEISLVPNNDTTAVGGGGGGSGVSSNISNCSSTGSGDNGSAAIITPTTAGAAAVISRSNCGSNMHQRRDEKRPKSVQLPVPALRKISTGELTVEVNKRSGNLSSFAAAAAASVPGRGAAIGYARENTTNGLTSKSDANNLAKRYAKAFASDAVGAVETTLTPASFCAPIAVGDVKKEVAEIAAQTPDVGQYYATLYGSIVGAASELVPAAAATASYMGAASDVNLTHGMQLSPAELIYLRQQQQQRQELSKVELDDKTLAMYNTYRQKLAAILKNNTVSIIEKYEKIVPD